MHVEKVTLDDLEATYCCISEVPHGVSWATTLKYSFLSCFTPSGTRRDDKDCIEMLELTFGFHHQLKMIPGIIRASGDEKEKGLQDVSAIRSKNHPTNHLASSMPIFLKRAWFSTTLAHLLYQ